MRIRAQRSSREMVSTVRGIEKLLSEETSEKLRTGR
jgi:hypothetical protein